MNVYDAIFRREERTAERLTNAVTHASFHLFSEAKKKKKMGSDTLTAAQFRIHC